jgi:hypothetical protein
MIYAIFVRWKQQLKKILGKRINIIWYWRAMLSPQTNLLAVTYANDKKTDGPGSQLQRIYGIYAISKFLKVRYIHSPLFKVDYYNFETLEAKTAPQEMLSKYNQIFTIPSNVSLPDNYIVKEIGNPDLNTLYTLKREAIKTKTFTLVKIKFPYKITDSYPETYQVIKKVSPFIAQKSLPLRVAMHMRRGELFLVAPERLLPNHYYISVAKKVCKSLENLNLPYQFEIYTEVALKNPEANKLEEFQFIPNLEIFINSHPIEPLRKMATADVLIISHSSYSYLASLLNIKGTIIYHNFWHKPLNNWIIANDSGDFSEQKLREHLKNLALPE